MAVELADQRPGRELLFYNLPTPKRSGKFMCRLCRQYGIKERKAHLKNYHKTDEGALGNKSFDDIVKIVFIEAQQ